MKKLSALILTYNEEDNIEDCIKSISWLNNIVIVDSYSEDNTADIASKYNNINIFKREFDDFASQRNYGLEKINTEWVFVIDADERVTPELKNEIIAKINNSHYEGYEIPRKNYFLGKWIRYCGWYPDFTLRLFKTKYRYAGLVHESPVIEGKISKLDSDLIHHTYKDLHTYINKMNHYTTLDAEKKFKDGKKAGVFKILFRPIFEFIKMFIFRLGIFNGKQGFILSVFSSYYQFIKNIKLWEKHNIISDSNE